MKFRALVVGMFLFTVFMTPPVKADNTSVSKDWQKPEWIADREKLKELQSEDCQKIWDILWPWAKRGNLEARLILLNDIEWRFIATPGDADSVSRVRDMVILTVHSSGFDGNMDEVSRDDPRKDIYDSEFFTLIYPQFLECQNQGKGVACAEKAVKDGFVPAFDKYAEEIDLRLRSGIPVVCLENEMRKNSEKSLKGEKK